MFITLISRFLSTFSFSSMDFHLRNLYHYHDSPNPSPQISPLTLPPYEILNHFPIHIHTLHIVMITMACLVTTIMLLVTIFISLRIYQNSRRRHNLNHNHNYVTRNTPILFDVHGYSDSNNNNNNDGVDDERNIVIDHPIWFIRTIGLQQSVIDTITVFKYRKNDGVIDGTECSVCLGEFEHEENLKLLPKCNHAFHITCIDTWLRSHKNCPLCRAPVFNDVAEVSVIVTDGETQNQEAQIENFNDDVTGLRSHDVGEFESIGDDGYSGEKKHVKRSFSMDPSSASMISVKHDGSGSSSSSIRRSFSQNGKFVFCNCRHCKSKSSTLPL